MTFVVKLFVLFLVTSLFGRLVRFLLDRGRTDYGIGLSLFYSFLGYVVGFILGLIILAFFI